MLNPVRILTITVLVLMQNVCTAQEICNNGMDDDGDGLIDLKDSIECQCKQEPIHSLIFNSSFDDTLCCPIGYSQTSCAKGWIRASSATSDYFNVCGYTNNPNMSKPPFLVGNGYVGYHDMDWDSIGVMVYKEYVGTCLNEPLKAGENYQLQLYLYHGSGDSITSIAAFGSTTCANLPFGVSDPFFGCPTKGKGWVGLDSANVTLSKNKWQHVTLNFTPSTNINTLVIGPSCRSVLDRTSATNNPNSGGRNYYYLDELTLNTESAFSKGAWITSSRHSCQEDIELNTQFKDKPNAIQWYKDQIALVGETGSSYNVPNGAVGEYQVRLEYDDTCYVSLPYHVSDTILVDHDTCKVILELFNVFTPGRDGTNDQWEIVFNGYDEIDVEIFNRWGEKVTHYTLPYDKSWNGKVDNIGESCPDGTYYYILKAVESRSGSVNKRSGIITLINE
ncbi:MAG: gliding motility-associated C-terminal domain-containing protein [Bacteroidia bacterium]|nr:gliding motility-associated C-terminal domain-containing protein [Bacteroidia bacterium]